ncbi:Glyoxalase/Bleomycin resistance protein/Dihydroxybiphenyl dioxygenase [Trichoderma ceciliae]
MSTPNPPSFFISLPVTSLSSSTDFYKSLSFTPLPDFSDSNTTAFRFPYLSNSNICLMLHSTSRFREFIRHGSEIVHAKKVTGAIYTLGVASREDVDGLLDKAEKAGGKRDPFIMEEYGKSMGIYTRSFEDLDGHIWEATTMLDKKAKDGA